MNSGEPIGIIELGNINIKCLIFNIKDSNDSEILSTSITSSEGIHNGTVVNLAKATNAIRFCISAAEKKAEVSIKKISSIFGMRLIDIYVGLQGAEYGLDIELY